MTSFYLNNVPVVDPRTVRKAIDRLNSHGISGLDTSLIDGCNSYLIPRGPLPGFGSFLIRGADLPRLKTGKHFAQVSLKIEDAVTKRNVVLNGLWIVNIESVTGLASSRQTQQKASDILRVDIADPRILGRLQIIYSAFNLPAETRYDAFKAKTETFLHSTLKDGTALYSARDIAAKLWERTNIPNADFTDVPGNIYPTYLFHGKPVYHALCKVLNDAVCDLVYNLDEGKFEGKSQHIDTLDSIIEEESRNGRVLLNTSVPEWKVPVYRIPPTIRFTGWFRGPALPAFKTDGTTDIPDPARRGYLSPENDAVYLTPDFALQPAGSASKFEWGGTGGASAYVAGPICAGIRYPLSDPDPENVFNKVAYMPVQENYTNINSLGVRWFDAAVNCDKMQRVRIRGLLTHKGLPELAYTLYYDTGHGLITELRKYPRDGFQSWMLSSINPYYLTGEISGTPDLARSHIIPNSITLAYAKHDILRGSIGEVALARFTKRDELNSTGFKVYAANLFFPVVWKYALCLMVRGEVTAPFRTSEYVIVWTES